MNSFASYILGADIKKGEVGVFFLGQAGFVFKTDEGTLIAVDPYLSNCCERYFGFKRLMPYVLDPRDIIFDYVVSTHAHYDHFDPDTVPILLENGKTKFVGALDTEEECARLGIKSGVSFIKVGDKVKLNDATLTAVKCDHGEGTPHAIGLLFEFGDKKVYIMGDTAYRPDWLSDPNLYSPDLLILPINGAYGNLNEEEAAKVISALSPKLSVPCHFWNFAEHFGNPYLFMNKMKELAPSADYLLMRAGELTVLK